MAIEKKRHLVWNGIAWIEIYSPTTDDLIYVEGGTKKLSTKLGEIDSDLTGHATNATLHKTSGDISKLANLDADADATYATKTELGTHTEDTDVHLSSGQASKLENLADDADGTYATKAELAGKTKSYTYDTYADMNSDLTNFTDEEIGVTCVVKDPSGDTDNIPEDFEGVAYYMLQYDDIGEELYWDFMYKSGGTMDLAVEWSEIEGKPSSSASAIDAAVGKAHEHANGSVLDDLDDDSGVLTYKGAEIGAVYSRIFMQELEPENPNTNDVWLAPVEED